MSATLIRTEIDRLFGDLSRDNRTALRDMRQIAAHAGQYADLLEEGSFEDDDEFEDDDFDDFDDDFDYEDDFDDDFEDDLDYDDEFEDDDFDF